MSDNDSEEENIISEGSSNSSVTGTTDNSGKDGTTSSAESFARSETRRVNRSKLIVVGVIAVAATAVATATFIFTRNGEQDDFETQYHDFAVEVTDTAHNEAFHTFGAIESFAATITSFSLATSLNWPQVTVPHFEIRGRKNNELSKAIQVSLVPLITNANKDVWEQYAVRNQAWIDEGLETAADFNYTYNPKDGAAYTRQNLIKSHVWRLNSAGEPVTQKVSAVSFGPAHYAPVWQQSPAPHDTSIINFDLLSHPVFSRLYHGMWETSLPVISEITDLAFLYEGAVKDATDHPRSFLLYPIYPTFSGEKPERDTLVGFVVAILPWDTYFSNVLPQGINGIVVVLHNSCGDHYTYRIDGHEAFFVGKGDLHDTRYNYLEVSSDFAPFLQHNFSGAHEHCEYDMRIYPSSDLESEYTSSDPILFAFVVLLIFVCTALAFIVYDYYVQVRQDKVSAAARRTNAIVTSLFPANVRDRIMHDAEKQAEQDIKNRKLFGIGAKGQLKDFLHEDQTVAQNGTSAFETKPIADLFPAATVLFADIVGFTAWSSVREPSQVFTLLEILFNAFDEIAKRRRVFKVETVGDCYVAVAGLPDKRRDHAVVMARFARDILMKMNDLTKRLELTLGPDTGDLSMRIGLHSGPVTAGVLRGEKSRFQLFGDTVNTASRIETGGARNRIHLSADTAQLLVQAGKSHWVEAREERVIAKGKGELQTFWLEVKAQSAASAHSGTAASETSECIESCDAITPADDKTKIEELMKSVLDDKTKRLVEWNSDVLARLLRQIVARRNALGNRADNSATQEYHIGHPTGKTVIDEVKEIINLPEFDAEALKNQQDPETIVLDPQVKDQLRNLVTSLATMYRANPFHSFEHASHVTMSVVKLLSRIAAPDHILDGTDEEKDIGDNMASKIHDHTYGITSDPLTQFACVFAALIHDVDHTGVPNAQLVKEKAYVAMAYKGKSVAEQNSVDVSWNLLMDPSFNELRHTICSTDAERAHFRELVVNSVMATDIVDKELKALRNARWDKAFRGNATSAISSSKENKNRKATIVIEHLIQASDIAHTMQHWHIYRKWNERLFQEMYEAYRKGRAETDPSEFWYKGEIGFFDFYIIPLAKKLKDCGVFGVSSDEYLSYAEKNRAEWEIRGEEVVAGMIEKYISEYTVPEINLDGIQDAENPPLRSRLFRSDTFSDDGKSFFEEAEKAIAEDEGKEVVLKECAPATGKA